MKKFFAFLTIGIFLFGCDRKEANTESPSTFSKTEVTELCEKIEWYAGIIMTNRQNGMSMSESIRVLNNTKSNNDETISKVVKQVAEQIIIDAYDVPEYSVYENQNEAINDFKNQQFRACYRSLIKE